MNLIKIVIFAELLVVLMAMGIWIATTQSTIENLIKTQELHLNFALQLQRDNVELMREQAKMREQLDEYQEWRLHITVASRMGWAQSARYIRDFPLEMEYGQ